MGYNVAMLRLSKPSKMPCLTWSLPARVTCPGSVVGGKVVDACDICYATQNRYKMSNVSAPRFHNMKDWKRGEWVDDMVRAIYGKDYFRFFDSGDIYCVELAKKIEAIVTECKTTRFWIPTRSWKIPTIRNYLTRMASLPNVVVRWSSDGIQGELVPGASHQSTIVQHPTDTWHLCEAYLNKGKCGDCRACWDKSVPVVSYIAHGHAAKRAYKTMEV